MGDGPILELCTDSGSENTGVTDWQERIRQIALMNRPNLDPLSEFASTFKAIHVGLRLPPPIQLDVFIGPISSAFQLPPMPICDLEAIRTELAGLGTAAAHVLQEWHAVADALAKEVGACRELLQSIQIAIPQPDPLWSDIFHAMDGDSQAAKRLVCHISWRPNHWQKEAIRLRARSVGSPPAAIREEALSQGLMMALQCVEDDELPLLVACQSTWLYETDQTLATICLNDLPVATFLEWLWQEAARAAGFWLLDMPYAPTVVLSVPPTDNSELQLAMFTSEATDKQHDNLRGRPFGSGIFDNCQVFLEEVRQAVVRLEQRGQRVTQERVAEVLYQKGLIGGQSSERQLRRWVREFGFSNWRELLAYL
jgi:hypothetical protein